MPPPHTYRPPRQSVPSAGEDRGEDQVQQGRARRSRACPFRQGIGAFPSPNQSSCRARGTRVPRSRFDRSAPATRAFRGRGPMAGCFPETAEWLLETPKHLLKTSKCLPQSFSPYPQNPRSENKNPWVGSHKEIGAPCKKKKSQAFRKYFLTLPRIRRLPFLLFRPLHIYLPFVKRSSRLVAKASVGRRCHLGVTFR